MRVDVDRPGEHDLARDLMGDVGAAVGRRLDDPIVADPHVADRVAAIGRIDDASAGDPRQHGACPSCAAICVMISPTGTRSVGLSALTDTNIPAAARCSTAS